MTVINKKIVVRVSEDTRLVVSTDDPASVYGVVERRYQDALGNDAWRAEPSDSTAACSLAELVRRHHRAGLLDHGLLDLRRDEPLHPPAPVEVPTTSDEYTVQYVAVPVDQVPEGVEAEYTRTEADARYNATGNNCGAAFSPDVWPREANSTWACVRAADLKPKVEPKSIECSVFVYGEAISPYCANCGRPVFVHPDDDIPF